MFKDEDHGYGGNVELEHYWAPCSGSLGKIYEVWIEFLPTPSLARNKRNIWGWRNIHGQSSSEIIQFWKASAHHCFRILRRKTDSQDQLFTVSLPCRLQSKKQKVKGIPEAAARNIQTHFSQKKRKEHLSLEKKNIHCYYSCPTSEMSFFLETISTLRNGEDLRGLDLVFAAASLARNKRNFWGRCKNERTVCGVHTESTLVYVVFQVQVFLTFFVSLLMSKPLLDFDVLALSVSW